MAKYAKHYCISKCDKRPDGLWGEGRTPQDARSDCERIIERHRAKGRKWPPAAGWAYEAIELQRSKFKVGDKVVRTDGPRKPGQRSKIHKVQAVPDHPRFNGEICTEIWDFGFLMPVWHDENLFELAHECRANN